MELTLSYFITMFIFFNILTMPSLCLRLPREVTVFTAGSSTAPFKPVVIIPGLNSTVASYIHLKGFIEQEHPGTEVHIVDVLMQQKSIFHPLWKQVNITYEAILPILKKSPDGIHVIGYSQGGLIARGIIETKDHNVTNFISLSSPQAGHYGDAFLSLLWIPKEMAYKIMYEEYIQDIFAVPGYWNDPHHQEEYLKQCKFLPVLNNERKGEEKDEFKENFLKLKNLILIGGPDDGLISPWQSSHFSFYDENEVVVDYRNRRLYEDDLFGLKTLDESGRLHVYMIRNVTHYKWHENMHAFRAILPWLD